VEYEFVLTRDDLRCHLGTLCEGYRCHFDELPGPFAVIAEATGRRSASFAVACSKFIDLLWKQRTIEASQASLFALPDCFSPQGSPAPYEAAGDP
jgi:hypothetical protein